MGCQKGRIVIVVKLSIRTWKHLNPEKTYFLNLSFQVFRCLYQMKVKDGLSYVRKQMIRCELGLDLSGTWRMEQPFPQFKETIEV